MYNKKYSYNISLKNLNTFGINVTAKKIIFVKTISRLIKTINNCKLFKIPYLILGEGSNVLFLEHYKGIVIFNRIKGITITENNNFWMIHVSSGEKWHNVVKYTLNFGIFGLENMALIPGRIGAAAIQNIGAYGLEFKDICSYVDVLFFKNNDTKRIDVNSCKFSYRSSVFKYEYNYDYAIIAVGIKLSKIWNPVIFPILKNYTTLQDITPYKIFNIICKIRIKKLPDPKKIGNAGSFFKNPIITKKQAYPLISLYKIPHYPQINGLIKISGGWLIEHYNFKNIQIGDAAIHKTQKLILINKKNATSKEVIKLARIIQTCILKKFNIFLEPEIDFIGSTRKIKLKLNSRINLLKLMNK
ncbi:UDP-N-acetylenolpyruvoylglucosamine reductase [Buchnera aphidicola (Diuraphis noxia)]|uniref:UDP-N-acetylenolpyruvoylglucosamine reductase n=1 Tax=Buchnera aphidicola subsp. Diuraphis noxia TaxID=118101 RepID=A0A1B2H8A0_BUCDN|nr:UDP-N-acetylmuramate dehydrogenase [Buchnera aphidicola]ANZ22296.1 UDP-N-acetylenolpyruvoylglucosamine reductase [Buchnera aphidicola (Diuraphis noxia)]